MIESLSDQLAPLISVLPEQKWHVIEITSDMTGEEKLACARLNSLGSLFWFSKYTLHRSRFSPGLHRYLADQLEQSSLRLALEVPRDHFKTSLASVCAPMWWALPFNDRDEELMRSFGYGDAWVRWMRRAHFSSTRTLIASETIKNAVKIGTQISGHYESNALFRTLFPEIIPKSSKDWGERKKKRWNLESMTHNRVDGEFHGEGTYDFIGVKGALQSRHYDRQVIDDPVGEKAIASDLVMESTIDWIRKLTGAVDSEVGEPDKLADQLFIGNRWSNRDVGTWLRKNISSMKFLTHDAEGGCCKEHPIHGNPIFPEEFSMEKLGQLRQIWGGYNYAAQYRNNPIDPEAVRFKPAWLRYYSAVPWSGQEQVSIANSQQLSRVPNPQQVLRDQARAEMSGAVPERLKLALSHEVQAGEVIEDMRAIEMERVAILDPNHSEESGRSRNAIVILGMYNHPQKPRRIYLLDVWAEASSHETMIDRLIGVRPEHLGLAVKWRVHHIYVESEVAGQQGWKFLLKDRVSRMGPIASFTIRPLKTDRSAGGKDKRIIGMESIYENGLFWVRRTGQEVFLGEYETYPNGATKDILDVIGYAPQTWNNISRSGVRDFVKDELQRRQTMMQSVGVAGY